MSQTRSIVISVMDSATASNLVSALKDASITSYGRVSETTKNAEDLLVYGPKCIIFDRQSFQELPSEELRAIRQCGVETLFVYHSGDLEGLPTEDVGTVSDFISLPAEPSVVVSKVRRAEEVFDMRIQRRSSGRLRKVEGEKPDTERRTRRLSRRLHDLERLKSNLITIISHEFKTPLHLASGYVNLLEDESVGPLNDEQRASIDTIKRQLTRLSDKLSDIERIAHLEMGLPEDLTERVDLRVLLGREIDGFKKGFSKKRLNLETELPTSLPEILGCQDFLTDVFRRLIDNAIHYTDAGGNISISAHAEDGEDGDPGVSILVKDSGKGIPASIMPHIFDRFGEFRDIEHHSSRRAGLGLGLAICRHLVEVHNGTISVTSEVGKGSVFTVWLPLEP